MIAIETNRLRLEPLDVSRLDEFIALTADPDVMRYWAPLGAFDTELAERNFVASLERLHAHGFGRRWVILKENGAGVGFTDTKYFGEGYDGVSPNEIEIGWMLTPAVWRLGFATEAGSAIRDEAFRRLGVDSIVAVHHPDNAASQRVIEKIGMSFEQDIFARSGWPGRLYRLTRTRWEALRS